MKQIEISIYRSLQPGGIKGRYGVPTVIPELTAHVPESRVVDLVNNQVLFHSVYGGFRDELSDSIIEFAKQNGATVGFKTTTKTVNGKTVEVIDESDEEFTRRMVAEGVISVAWLSTRLQELCDDPENAYELYLKSPERKPRAPKHLPKDLQAYIDSVAATGKLAELATKVSALVGRTLDPNDPVALGWAMKEHRDAALAKANADLLALAGK